MKRKIDSARCINCDESDWENVDEHMHKPQGAFICRGCGLVTYDSIVDVEKTKEFYRKEYRPAPTIQNENTCERKNHYHNAFLKPLFDKWKKEGTNPVVFEVGAAYGRLLHMIRHNFPEADVSGTELTTVMRRVAKNYLDIELNEEFDKTKKYDLIITYKVAEHMPNVDKDLQMYADHLKEDGLLYIGVPVWFNQMNNFGVAGFNLETYYHPNHINMWTREIFESCLDKAGLEIEATNFVYYDNAYLCFKKERPDGESWVPFRHHYKEIINRMKTIKEACTLFDQKKYLEAADKWNNYPVAYSHHYELNRKYFHTKGFEIIKSFLRDAIKNCPDSSYIVGFAADVHMRYNDFIEAIKLYEIGLKMRPNCPNMTLNLSHCFRNLKRFDDSMHLCKILNNVSTELRPEAITWILHDCAQMPLPGEKNA